MNEEKRFDELIQSKLSEREFPFDELNWDEAEKQIIRLENRQRITRYSLIFGSGLIAGIALMLPFILNNPAPKTIVIHDGASQPVIAANITSTNKPSPSTSVKNIPGGSALVSSVKTTGNSVPNAGITSTKPQKGYQPASSPLVARTQNMVSPQSPNRLNWVKKDTENNGAGFATSSYITPPLEIADAQYNDSYKEITPVIPLPINNEIVNNDETPVQNLPQITWFNPVNFPTDSNHGKFVIAKNKDQASAAALPKKDSMASNVDMLRVHCATGTGWGRPKNSIFIDGGFNYAFGWNNNGSKEGNGLTPIIGVSFNHYFSNRISASIGIQSQWLDNLNKTYSSQTTQFDFGANENVTDITPKTLYYIGIPLKGQFNISNKLIVGGGINILYLLTTSSTETSYKQTFFGTTNSTSSTKSGYMDGFNSSDLQVSLGCTYMLTEKLGLNAEYYYGLLNVENSTFFGANQFDRNTGLRLVVSYQVK